MILILEDATDEFVSAVGDAFERKAGTSTVTTKDRISYDLSLLSDKPGTLQIYREYPRTGDVAEDRHTDLVLASKGVRYWGSRLNEHCPTYAGPLPELGLVDKLLLDGEYSENRTKYINSLGVQYTGRTYASPKVFFVLDAKRKIDAHSPSDNPKLRHLLVSLPEDLWGTAALISTSSTKRLEHILEEHDQTIPITTSTATSAKLKFAGLDFVETALPSEPSREYGISLRSSVTLFERL